MGRHTGQDGNGPGREPRQDAGHQGKWLYRAVRGARPDRNPLRRGTDRLETFLLVGVFAAAAAGAPFAAMAARDACYAASLQQRQEQLAARHQVSAVLTETADRVSGYTAVTKVSTEAAWTSPDGVRRSGQVPAEPGSPRGTAVTVWTDANGYLVSPPLSPTQVSGQAEAAMIGAIAGVVVVSVAGAAGIRQVLYRRRMAAWEADWLTTERTWNHQSW